MRQPIRKSKAEANNIEASQKGVYSLVVDGNNLLKISLVDKRFNSNGESYGAVYTFVKMLGDVLKKKDFDYCHVCFDGEGSGVMRYSLYKDYKANRGKDYESRVHETEYDRILNEYARNVMSYHKNKANEKKETVTETEDESFARQKTIINEILEELCIRQHEFEDVEGDDLIAYYVKNKPSNEKVVIMSSDKDLTQLISDTVVVYNPRLREFITKDNAVEKLGVPSDNIVLEKVLCGDQSDNIKGVKGLGEQTLVKYIPEIKERPLTLEDVKKMAAEILEERKASKKKPLKVLENVLEGVTDGCQGDRLYEINEAIISLKNPMLTEEASKYMDDESRFPMDTADRSVTNIYGIIRKEGMNDMMDESRFGELFSPYSRIMTMEKRRFMDYEKSMQ